MRGRRSLYIVNKVDKGGEVLRMIGFLVLEFVVSFIYCFCVF